MYRTSQGPKPLTISLIGIVLVFGGYLLWTGFRDWVEEGNTQNRINQRTEVAESTATAEFFFNQPTLVRFPTPTPIPDCEYFTVRGQQAVWVRSCPSTDCEAVTYLDPDTSVCVIGRAFGEEYVRPAEWYQVLLEPDDILPEISYMHESVLKALNPTPTATNSPEPLPTVTRTPTPSREPTTLAPTQDPRTPTITPTPRPTNTPQPTDSGGIEI